VIAIFSPGKRTGRSQSFEGAIMAKRATQLFDVGVVLLATSLGLHSASAFEPGQSSQTKSGITLGASAAPLPDGLYMIDHAFYYGFGLTGPGIATANAPPRGFAPEASADLLWVPGWNFLGGTYSALFAFPFNAVSVASVPSAGFPGVSFAGVHNSFIAPLRLQWNLGHGVFAQAGVGVYVPDGNVSGPLGNSNVGAPYYTVQPDLVLSYVKDGWNLTAYTYYEHNTKNERSGYISGDIFHADLTATKQFGKWTVGPVAYYAAQVTSDKSSATFDTYLDASIPVPGGIHGFNAGRFEQFAVGGLLGYDFGLANLTVYATDDVLSRAFGGNSGTRYLGDIPFTSETTSRGWSLFGRLIFPLLMPEAPTQPKKLTLGK
jgi:hypothetical protein